MWDVVIARLKQGNRTVSYPKGEPVLPELYRGLPVIDAARCLSGCRECADACPTQAIKSEGRGLKIDLGRCLFCTDCADACPEKVFTYYHEFRMAARKKEDLVAGGPTLAKVQALDAKMLKLFGRSLKLRQVSAGGCNGCESDVNVLNTIVYDLGRFGIQFVASPRHADGLLITGPVTENMKDALLETYAAVPAPKIVIAVGACAISGGPYVDHPEVHNGADSTVAVDLYIPGCPPHPLTILDGLLRLLGRIK
jgi:Ni,Fe-hydrogenase III small subunit/Pyruvate/2-oxoacid:ferredoxin oxidoreductase delta subunit